MTSAKKGESNMSKTTKIILLVVAIITLIGTIVGISIVKKDRYYDEDIIVQDVSKPETIEFQIENETYKITMPANTEFAIQKPNDTAFVISYAVGGTPIADDHTISFVKELPNDNLDKIKNGPHKSYISPKENGEVALYRCTEGELEGTTCFLIIFKDKDYFVYFETREEIDDLKEMVDGLSIE